MSNDHPTFKENIERMAKAGEVFIRVDSARRIFRAAEHKARKNQNYEIGGGSITTEKVRVVVENREGNGVDR